MDAYVKIVSGEISRSYLTKVSRAKFDIEYSHISEDERNHAWKQTHDDTPIPKSDKPNHKKPIKVD